MKIAVSASSGRMGRKPLGIRQTSVRLSKETVRRIEEHVGKNRMATFIREAVANELEKRDAKKAKKDQRG